MTLDITDCMQRACESIVDPIVENVKKLIAGSNPEYHDEFRKNMVLAGGGSSIKGLGALIERRLSDMGDVNVHVVDDPVRLGAMGGLRLAMEVPEDMWKNLTLASAESFVGFDLLSSSSSDTQISIYSYAVAKICPNYPLVMLLQAFASQPLMVPPLT